MSCKGEYYIIFFGLVSRPVHKSGLIVCSIKWIKTDTFVTGLSFSPQTCLGVKGLSALHILPSFDVVDGNVIDYYALLAGGHWEEALLCVVHFFKQLLPR